MRGYKIFGPDYTCKGYKYSLDAPNVYNGYIEPRKTGFHFCRYTRDCEKYYNVCDTNTYALVESGENYTIDDDKVVCDHLVIVKTLTKDEFLKCADGEYKSWHKNGKLREDVTYVNGKQHGSYKSWYPCGQICTEKTYDNGILNGDHKSWYPCGQLYAETTYKNGELHGSYKSWYPCGQLHIETTYVDGKLHGSYKSWFENGYLYTETTYDNGKLMYTRIKNGN